VTIRIGDSIQMLNKLAGIMTISGLLMLSGCSNGQTEQTANNAPESESTAMATTDYMNVPVATIDGEETSLSAYEGNVLLVVNTASKCGYTPQYEGLETLYQEYKDSGLVVIGFPANNFGGQEPGTNEEIAEFCQTRFGVTFPMMAKVSVKGEDKHPVFKHLTEEAGIDGEIGWNFSKFLIDREGNLVARYESKVTPSDPQLVSKVEELL